MTEIMEFRSEVDQAYHIRRSIIAESEPIIVDTEDPDDAEIERNIRIEMMVFQDASHQSTTMAQVAMRALWEVKSKYDGAYQLVFGVPNLKELVRKVLGNNENLDYTVDIVERVLPHVNRFDDPHATNEPDKKLNPIELIETPGLVQKLKASSYHFSEAIASGDEKKQAEIINTVMTESASAVKALISSYNTPEITISCEVREYEQDGEWFYQPIFPPLSREQWLLMKANMGRVLSIT